MKIVVNKCYGGFSLSQEAYRELGLKWDGYGYYDCSRSDENLVRVVEKLGDKANGSYAKLRIVEIPDDVNWEIDDYDGIETVREKHRSW